MKSLSRADIAQLIKGASALATGGGLCYDDQMKSLEKHAEFSVVLRPLESFAPDDLLLTAAEVGPASAPEIQKEKILPQMVALWERLTGRKVAGVYPAEVGQEMVTLETAAALNVPVADFDPAGGRAVPLIDISVFNILGMPYSLAPLVLATDRDEILAVDGTATMERAEDILRTLTGLSKDNIVFFIGGAIRAGDLQGKGIGNRCYSRALECGTATSLDDLQKKLSPSLTLTGRVVAQREIERAGFNCFEATFDAGAAGSYTLKILNEVLYVFDSAGQRIAAPPQRILIIDPETLAGLPSKALLAGAPTVLMVAEADALWQTPAAQRVFGAERFPFLSGAE